MPEMDQSTEAPGLVSNESRGFCEVGLQSLVATKRANCFSHVGCKRANRRKRRIELVGHTLCNATQACQTLRVEEPPLREQDLRSIDVEVHDARAAFGSGCQRK